MVHDFIYSIHFRDFIRKYDFKKQIGFLKPDYRGELYASAITLKNLALVRKNKPLSADYIFEILMGNSMKLKKIYQELITVYRSERSEEAFRVFSERVGSKEGKAFSAILQKLDKINPSELIEQIDVFRQMMLEEITTDSLKRAQRNSVLTTAWATAGMFAMMINFICVVVLMDTLTMLEHLF